MTPIFAAGILGFAMGAGLIMLIPQRQSTLRLAIGMVAICLLVADFLGYHLIKFGTGLKTEDLEGQVSLSAMMWPRIFYLAVLMGISSVGINRKVHQYVGLGLVVAVFVAPGFVAGLMTQPTTGVS